MMRLIENYAIPINLVNFFFFFFFFGRLNKAIGRQNNGRLSKILNRRIFFTGPMIDQRLMSRSANNLRFPLIKQSKRQNNQSASLEVRNHCSNHNNGFSKTHFIGHEPSTDTTNRYFTGLIFKRPLNPHPLMGLRVQFSFLDVVVEFSHHSSHFGSHLNKLINSRFNSFIPKKSISIFLKAK